MQAFLASQGTPHGNCSSNEMEAMLGLLQSGAQLMQSPQNAPSTGRSGLAARQHGLEGDLSTTNRNFCSYLAGSNQLLCGYRRIYFCSSICQGTALC